LELDMARPLAHFRLLAALACLLAALAALPAALRGDAGIAPAQTELGFPPGVRLLEPDARADLLPGIKVQLLEVDWTDPLLAADYEDALTADPSLPRAWDQLARREPDSLCIQLIEPLQDAAGWRLALPATVDAPAGAGSTASAPADRPAIAIDPYAPWLPDARALVDQPEWLSPLAASPRRVAVRWWGTRAALGAWPSLPYRDRCLVSFTNLASGHTRFALLARETPGQADARDLAPWLRAMAGPVDWIALHSLGPGVIVGRGDWRMVPTADPRRPDRLGVVLKLSARRAGDLVDWVRIPGARSAASSAADGFAPPSILRGLLWPNPLQPRVWMSRAADSLDSGDPAPWFEIRFDVPRPVSRVVLAWASAAGWSAGFDPAHVRLLGVAASAGSPRLLADWSPPDGPLNVWDSQRPMQFQSLRVEFPGPSRMPLDRRARLASFQVWGPWDGRL
jgi:hypothetical protein